MAAGLTRMTGYCGCSLNKKNFTSKTYNVYYTKYYLTILYENNIQMILL